MNLIGIPHVSQLIDLAINEDLSLGDITSELTVPKEAQSKGIILAKEPCLIAGIEIAEAIFKRIDEHVTFTRIREDGESVEQGEKVASVEGTSRSILAAERTALNFLQRLCGIATMTHRVADLIDDTGCRIIDTRKTTPGWRILEKYAVRVGGGGNHRLCLGDGILIKENHIKAAGGIKNAVTNAMKHKRHPLLVQVEVTSFEEAETAVAAGSNALLLDNMPIMEIKKIADRFRSEVILEASGNITRDTISIYARSGIHLISMGAITHSAPSVDLSLLFL